MSYLQLSDYGLIGNASSSALVSKLGSIDWCCFPFLDSPCHFGALLDEVHGGRFQIMPQGDFRSEQRYLQRTPILETSFETPHGRATLTDWMPASDGLDPPTIFRKLEVTHGKINWLLVCMPRFDYGSQAAEAELRRADGVLFRGPATEDIALFSSPDARFEISANGNSAVAKFSLSAGQRARFSWSWGRQGLSGATDDSLHPSADHWRIRAHRCEPGGCPLSGPWHDASVRSGLVLHLLSSRYSGGIAEAVTTSIPGSPGESRTWDYRYAWLRDGAWALQALPHAGTPQLAEAFFSWVSDVVRRDGPESLQPVYTLDGGKSLPERELPFLSGYQGARPVRVGNQSSQQFELGTYGHVMLMAAEHFRRSGALPDGLWDRLTEIADYVCQAWRRPDHGPWETRNKAEHFVSSKVLCWAALDRAIWLAGVLSKELPQRWISEREILHRTVCQQGYDERTGSFVRSFHDRELDASVLIIPMLGFLPFEDPRVHKTLDTIRLHLSEGVFLHRYRNDDGMPGSDGAHLTTSFLFVSCLALAGRVEEASDRLAELCTYCTPLGLFAEQVNLSTQETMGNFPSASVHVALINAAVAVGAARGHQVGKLPLSQTGQARPKRLLRSS